MTLIENSNGGQLLAFTRDRHWEMDTGIYHGDQDGLRYVYANIRGVGSLSLIWGDSTLDPQSVGERGVW
jgi:hypothetical protein